MSVLKFFHRGGALLKKDNNFEEFKQQAQQFMCRILPNLPYSSTQCTQDYILVMNPLKMSYMVGYGPYYPKRVHHRGSSLPSLSRHPPSFGCEGGFQPFFYYANPNPNILIGAVVGGPNQKDGYSDDRTDCSHSKPATYVNAAIVGPLAYFARGCRG